jgi:hypothetical protein
MTYLSDSVLSDMQAGLFIWYKKPYALFEKG